MFGVDKTGRDVLAPQFSQGAKHQKADLSGYTDPKKSKYAEAFTPTDPEMEMSIASNIDSFRADPTRMQKYTAEAQAELTEKLGRAPRVQELKEAVEKKVRDKAVELSEKSRIIDREAAARAVVRVSKS